MNDNLYREEILEHYQNPQNFGRLSKFDISSKQTNPFCGDEIEIFLNFNKKPWGVKRNTPPGCKIYDISFLGRGCAICIAATSILTEFAKGKTKKELTKFMEKDMLDLLQIEVSETRKKCALIGWSVLKDCLYAKIQSKS